MMLKHKPQKPILSIFCYVVINLNFIFLFISICICNYDKNLVIAKIIKDAEKSSSEAHKAYISLVTIPIFSHFEPLAAMAEELHERGYRVSLALPEGYGGWVEKFAPHAQFIACGDLLLDEDLEELEMHSFLVPAGMFGGVNKSDSSKQTQDISKSELYVTNFTNDSNYFSKYVWDTLLPNKDAYDSVAYRLRYYASFQKSMLSVLMHAHAIDVPDLIVVDRYAFAGIGSANYHHVNFVINSPSLLNDIDNPAQYVPAPFSFSPAACGQNLKLKTFGKMGQTSHSNSKNKFQHENVADNFYNNVGNVPYPHMSINNRFKNYLHRLMYRVAVRKSIREIYAMWNVNFKSGVINEDKYYKERFIFVNSIFGIDDDRDLSPLITMVGGISLQTDPNIISTNDLIDHLPEHIYRILSFGGKTDSFKTGKNNVLIDLNRFMTKELKDKLTSLSNVFILDPPYNNDNGVNEMGEIVTPILLQNVFKTLNVSIFVTTGELSSVQKAFMNCIPVIIIPLTAEQLDIGKRVERSGAGILLNIVDVITNFNKNIAAFYPFDIKKCKNTETGSIHNSCVMGEMIKKAIFTITNDNRKRQAACRLKSKLLAGGGLQRAVRIIEGALAIGVGPFVNDVVPWYSKNMLDVYLLYSVVLFCIYIMVKTMMSACSALWESVVNPSVTW